MKCNTMSLRGGLLCLSQLMIGAKKNWILLQGQQIFWSPLEEKIRNNSTIKTSTVSSDICICYWAIDLLQPVSLKCDAICELWMVIFSWFRPINQTGAEKVQHEVFFLNVNFTKLNWKCFCYRFTLLNFSKRPMIDGIPQSRQNAHIKIQIIF